MQAMALYQCDQIGLVLKGLFTVGHDNSSIKCLNHFILLNTNKSNPLPINGNVGKVRSFKKVKNNAITVLYLPLS